MFFAEITSEKNYDYRVFVNYAEKNYYGYLGLKDDFAVLSEWREQQMKSILDG